MMAKQKLIPLHVAWMVSPSTPFLRLFAAEDCSDEKAYVEFCAYYKCEGDSQPRSTPEAIRVVQPPESFRECPEERGPNRLVRVEFENARWVRMSPAHAEYHIVPDEEFDWSAVPRFKPVGMSITEFLHRNSLEWRRSGICPNPRAFTVEGSLWLRELNAKGAGRGQRKHYLFLGHESYAEIVADGHVIREGQVLKGW
jgi:hypothetical protein